MVEGVLASTASFCPLRVEALKKPEVVTNECRTGSQLKRFANGLPFVMRLSAFLLPRLNVWAKVKGKSERELQATFPPHFHFHPLMLITPLILTFNEAPNIRRTLEKVAWAMEILIVDSFSTDETLEIVKDFPQARIVQRKFDTFAGQCNFGVEQIKTEWVLSLDADYVLSEELNRELVGMKPDVGIAGYRAAFTYCVYGKPLRATLYPPRTVLYRKALARYHDEGHGHRVQINGSVVSLQGKILHDDRKPLERWFSEQIKYANREAEFLGKAESGKQRTEDRQKGEVSNQWSVVSGLTWPDRIRQKIILAPFLIFFYTLFGKGLILDGWPGWFYVFQRTLAEMILSLKLLEQKLKR
jgi:glycosyltransferase involved in cell wall biosynthesis